MTKNSAEQLLLRAAENLVLEAKKAGATASDAIAGQSVSVGISVRNGVVEDSENAESSSIAFRVFVGNRVASISADATADPQALAERAVAMAKASPEDMSQGLADADLLAHDVIELDLFDATEPGADRFREMALECEAAALGVKGITNSLGINAQAFRFLPA
jgi:PmbA protein